MDVAALHDAGFGRRGRLLRGAKAGFESFKGSTRSRNSFLNIKTSKIFKVNFKVN